MESNTIGPKPWPFFLGDPGEVYMPVARVYGTALAMLPAVLETVGDPTRQGGYLCVFYRPEIADALADPDGLYQMCLEDLKDRTPLLHVPVGQPDVGELDRYVSSSKEKALRLGVMKFQQRHVSSWQSRVPKRDRYGGAIIADNFILSFSGLPELADEAFMHCLAVALDYLTEKEAAIIALCSDNSYFLSILAKVKQMA